MRHQQAVINIDQIVFMLLLHSTDPLPFGLSHSGLRGVSHHQAKLVQFGELAGVGSVGEQIDMTDAAMGGIDVDVAGLDGGVMAVELDKKDRDTLSESDEDDLPQPALARRQDPTQIVQSVAQKSASELGMLI